MKFEPRILNLIASRRIEEACGIAVRRLQVSGLSPHRVEYAADEHPVRLAASLIIPVRDQYLIESLVMKNNT